MMKKLYPYFYLSILFSGCMFYSFKGSLPAHINTINIAAISNETAEFGLSEAIMSQITDQIIRENVLDIAGEDDSDSRLAITVKSVHDKPQSYTAPGNDTGMYERVEEWQIKITVEVSWHDLTRDETLFEKTFKPHGSYGTGTDISTDRIDNDNEGLVDDEDDDEFGLPRESALRIAIEKLAEEIINQITSTW